MLLSIDKQLGLSREVRSSPVEIESALPTVGHERHVLSIRRPARHPIFALVDREAGQRAVRELLDPYIVAEIRPELERQTLLIGREGHSPVLATR